MTALIGCFTETYNPWLLAIAVLVCCSASFMTFSLLPRTIAAWGVHSALLWSTLTMVTGAAGIWATHFTAMMAFRPGAEIGFDTGLTAVSLIIAMLVIGIAVYILGTTRTRGGQIVGGVVLGSATALMHYSGVSGMAVAGIVIWSPGPVIVSVGCAVALAVAAVLASGLGTTLRQRARGAALYGLSIVSLHFTGMDAVTIVPDPRVALPASLLSGNPLALAVAGVTLLIIGAAAVAFLVDFRMRRESEVRFVFMARHDALTGLPNRLRFKEVVDRALATEGGADHHGCIFCLDLDGFKEVNDTFGHAAGDQVLVEVGRRLTLGLGDRWVAARLGGDEFAVLAPGSALPAHRVAQAIIDAVAQPFDIASNKVDVGCSIGVAQFPTDGADYPTLLAHADMALTRAKQDGRGVFRFFDAAMDDAARERRAMLQDLRGALRTGQLRLHYQPQISVATRRILGFEALLRWTHPTRGTVPPSTFIPVAEESGLILPIGAWVLREACREAASWAVPLRVAVNMSVAQFRQSDLVDTVRQVLDETGLAPERLEIEVTESLFFDGTARTLQVLEGIKALGVRIAMDDFGTGYSSLSTLQSFAFDVIKIDRAFTGRIGEVAKSTAIVKTIVGLGQSLDIEIVAEGVETPEQLAFLADQGCGTVQGFLVGRPQPAAHYAEQTSPPASADLGNVVTLRVA